MKMKKIISILLAMVMVFALAACGGSSDDSSGDTSSDSSGDGDEKVVTIWSWSPLTRTMEKMIEAFEEENPDIKIDFTYYNYDPEYLSALSAAAASDSLPDIIATQPGSLTQQYADYLIDLSDYATKAWSDDWESNFSEVVLNQLYLGNDEGDTKLNFLPIEAQVISVEYNKTLFEELSLKVPTNYDELKAVCNTLTENGYAPLFQGGASDWHNLNVYMMLVSQYGTEHFDKAQNGELEWTDDVFVSSMDTWKKMFDDGIFQTGALSATCYSDGTTAFTSGQAGMIALGSWWTQEYTGEDVAQTVADWDFDYFYLPAMADGLSESAPIGGVDFGMGITENCEDVEAAWTVLQSMVSGAGIQACADDLNNLPAFKGIEPKAEDLPEDIVEQFNRSSEDLEGAMNQRVANPTVDTAIKSALQAVASGEMTSAEAMKTVQDAQDALN
ncbi:MAG: ABC transporter substrate-binding protein [Lachnospiraceae bacterium]